MAAIHHLDFSKFAILVKLPGLAYNSACFLPPNSTLIGWYGTAEMLPKNDCQYGGRPPSWECFDVSEFHLETESYVLDTVLSFHDDWFRIFLNTLIFMFLHLLKTAYLRPCRRSPCIYLQPPILLFTILRFFCRGLGGGIVPNCYKKLSWCWQTCATCL